MGSCKNGVGEDVEIVGSVNFERNGLAKNEALRSNGLDLHAGTIRFQALIFTTFRYRYYS